MEQNIQPQSSSHQALSSLPPLPPLSLRPRVIEKNKKTMPDNEKEKKLFSDDRELKKNESFSGSTDFNTDEEANTAKKSLICSVDKKSRCKPKYNVSFSEKTVFYEHKNFTENEHEISGVNNWPIDNDFSSDYDNLFDEDRFKNQNVNDVINNCQKSEENSFTLGGLLELKRECVEEKSSQSLFSDSIHKDLESVLKELDIITSLNNSDHLNSLISLKEKQINSTSTNQNQSDFYDFKQNVQINQSPLTRSPQNEKNNSGNDGFENFNGFTKTKNNSNHNNSYNNFNKKNNNTVNNLNNNNENANYNTKDSKNNEIISSDSVDNASENSYKKYESSEISEDNGYENELKGHKRNVENSSVDINDIIRDRHMKNNNENELSKFNYGKIISYNEENMIEGNFEENGLSRYKVVSRDIINDERENLDYNININRDQKMHNHNNIHGYGNNTNFNISHNNAFTMGSIDNDFHSNNDNFKRFNVNHGQFNFNNKTIQNFNTHSFDNAEDSNHAIISQTNSNILQDDFAPGKVTTKINNDSKGNFFNSDCDSVNDINGFNENFKNIVDDQNGLYSSNKEGKFKSDNTNETMMNFERISFKTAIPSQLFESPIRRDNINTGGRNLSPHSAQKTSFLSLPFSPNQPFLQNSPLHPEKSLFHCIDVNSSTSSQDPHFDSNIDDNSSLMSDKKNDDQVLIKVYSEDESSKTVSIDSSTTVRNLCDLLIKKYRHPANKAWSLVEHWSDLNMERLLEEHLVMMDELKKWSHCLNLKKLSKNEKKSHRNSNCSSSSINSISNILENCNNTLWFVELPKKYGLFQNKQILRSFSEGSYIPDCEGPLYLKSDSKKSWKKYQFVLRASGLYYSPKGKANKPHDLERLVCLDSADILTGRENWDKMVKAPTNFGIIMKQVLSKGSPDHVSMKYLCADDAKSMYRWFDCLRLVKFGKQLYDNYETPIKVHKTQPGHRPPTANWSNMIDCELERVASIHKQHNFQNDLALNRKYRSNTRSSSVYSDEIPNYFKSLCNNQSFSIQPINNYPSLNCSSPFLNDSNLVEKLSNTSPGFRCNSIFNYKMPTIPNNSALRRGSEGMRAALSDKSLAQLFDLPSNSNNDTNQVRDNRDDEPDGPSLKGPTSFDDPWLTNNSNDNQFINQKKLFYNGSLKRNYNKLQNNNEPIYESIIDHDYCDEQVLSNPQPDVLSNLSKSKSQENFLERDLNSCNNFQTNIPYRKSTLRSSADQLNDYLSDQSKIQPDFVENNGNIFMNYQHQINRPSGQVKTHNFPRPRTPEIFNFLAQNKKNFGPVISINNNLIFEQQSQKMYSRNHSISRSFNTGLRKFNYVKSSDDSYQFDEGLTRSYLESPAYDNPDMCLMKKTEKLNLQQYSNNWDGSINFVRSPHNNRNSSNSYQSNSSNSSGFHSNGTKINSNIGNASIPSPPLRNSSTKLTSVVNTYNKNQSPQQHPLHYHNLQLPLQANKRPNGTFQTFEQNRHQSQNLPANEYFETNNKHAYLICNT